MPVELGYKLTSEGYIEIDAAYRTTIPGIYVCGDNVTRIRTVSNAVAMGTIAGMTVNRDLTTESF